MTHLIDDVARTMTGAAARAGMRETVLSRIERRPRARFLWAAAPVAAAALVVLAVGLRNAGTNSGVAPLVPTIAQTSPVAGPVTVASESTRSGSGVLQSRRKAASLPQVRTISALKEPVALAGSSIQPDALAIPLLQLKPIVTEPIAIRVIGDDPGGRE